jgi:acylphosphatase
VEVVAEGGEQAMAQLEARLREGPSFAHVASVERSVIAGRGDHGFHIR